MTDTLSGVLRDITALLVFPGGLMLILGSLAYEWAERKLAARLQNRVGPRLIQPLADLVKLLAKEEIKPDGVNTRLFQALPIVALAGGLTAALYVPLIGLDPSYSFPGDLVVAIYLLSLLTLCSGLAGIFTADRFSIIGATRVLTQLFAYEAPFLLALLGPALAAGSWQIANINAFATQRWLIVTQPIGFLVALIGLIGKLERPPFDAPEAKTEIVGGALTEYSGRGLALFRLSRNVEFVVGLTLIAAFFLGGITDTISFLVKTLGLLAIATGVQVLLARLRIDQTVGFWWRWGALLALFQMLFVVLLKG